MGGALHSIDKAKHVPAPRYLHMIVFMLEWGGWVGTSSPQRWSALCEACIQGLTLGEVTRTAAARCREENGRFSHNQFLYYYSHRQLPAVSPHPNHV